MSRAVRGRTQVFANVLNLNDRSMPWPFSVSAHLPDTKLFNSLDKVASSEPSANLAWGAIAWAALENDRVKTVVNSRLGYLHRTVVMTLNHVSKILSRK